jgi:hypothetical protein
MPILVRVRPLSGWPRTVLVVNGGGFDETLGGNVAEVGGVPALVLRASNSQLVVLVGDHAKSGSIHVTTSGSTTTAPDHFKVLSQPGIRDSRVSGPPIFYHARSTEHLLSARRISVYLSSLLKAPEGLPSTFHSRSA